MDRKTLEYLEDRAKKARMIVEKIEELSKFAEKVRPSNNVIFVKDGYRAAEFTDNRHRRVLLEIQNEAMQIIADEINRLEQELAEL